jgi:CRP-like cAMP-binding protein
MDGATVSPDELRTLPLLHDLTDDEAAWVAARCEVQSLAAGDVLFRAGEPVEWMYLTLAGELEARRDDHGAGAPAFVWGAGDVAGIIPFSRMTVAPGTGRAVVASRVARFPKAAFGALLARVPRLEPRFVAHLTDRVRESTRRDQQTEKLSALGRMAAGLAHELNNPAAAAQRFASELARGLEALDDGTVALAAAGVGADAMRALHATRRGLGARRSGRAGPSSESGDGERAGEDPLARSEREDALADWLVGAGVADPWIAAAALADASVGAADLAALAAVLPAAARAPAASWLAAALAADALVAGIGDACGRITALVASVKTYTHMDRAGVEEDVDLRAGLESTLALFAHRVRQRGLRVERDYAARSRACAAGRGSSTRSGPT